MIIRIWYYLTSSDQWSMINRQFFLINKKISLDFVLLVEVNLRVEVESDEASMFFLLKGRTGDHHHI